MSIPLRTADVLITAAQKRASAVGVPMVVAVCDQAGVLQRYSRMDGAIQISVEIAQNKAFTSAILGLPTDVLAPLVQPGAEFYSLMNSHQGRLVAFGGGLPLSLDGRVVAALGVSGGSAAQDLEVAHAAQQAWEAMACLASGLGSGPFAEPGKLFEFDQAETDPMAFARELIAGAYSLARCL